ncbi:alpha/beta hydrolase [Pantoea sp. At-9b]|uniref:alpha/beta hydrolase n=1 Tax=Pantoea sp. (strain At-9b) TaxID=592316 RepID=UPI0001F26046|nr:alpha/beta hydrolase [Pantoea sp. At-9b]ADU72270.1 putative esterase [Pantoea sp. At-9b]
MNHPLCSKICKSISSQLTALFLIFICASNSYARPDMRPLGPNIADKGSAFYSFSITKFDSTDGQRHYQVWTAVPKKAPPEEGFPVLYMLDGNAVMDRLSDGFLKELSSHTPPVIIIIGYQTPLPFDLHARAYDYTPSGNGKVKDMHGRIGGGSINFRHLIEESIAPRVERNIRINTTNRGIWGHSYGGLFVLDSWLYSSFFHSFYSASPSLGNDNNMMKKIMSVPGSAIRNKRLYLMEGDGDEKKTRDGTPSEILKDVQNMISTLSAEGISASYQLYSGLTHGSMFNASLQWALLNMSEDKVICEKDESPSLPCKK